jgi:hypothetical protein
MALSMYDASVPVFARALGQLSHVLDKGEAHAAAQGIDPATLLQARLAPDMLPLSSQVQIASDNAKGPVARLAGSTPPAMADTETSFDELRARIARTQDYLKSVDRAQIDGSEGRPISLKVGPYTIEFTGQRYLLEFALPNFFFHITTAYDILRNQGVGLAKRDYLGRF